mmetsp:Transcript_13968/g.33794  ORF Transcript_13968/g.33794 Transcript_13968/m.33794 type:complete len:874 (+) Transcript_13968:112-2733(+)
MKAISLCLLILCVVLILSDVNHNYGCQAFTFTTSSDANQAGLASSVSSKTSATPPSDVAFASSTTRRIFTSSKESSSKKKLTLLYAQQKTDNDEAVLSDLDARVLQEMLRSTDKLDLQDERNMKDLLDRGIKAKERSVKDETSSQQDEQDSEFKSEVLQKLGSTKLWKAFKRKLQDGVDSAKIYVANRIERDAKLVASLGIFAFERAMTDVSRALPATSSSRWNPKKQFLLSNVTAAQEMTEAEKLRQEMSTPMDEIRNVGRQLKDIFRGVTQPAAAPAVNIGIEPADPNDVVTPRTTYSRNLNSAAASSKYSVNDKDRFDKAYKRKQETTLKREKENVIQSSTRLANEVADGAYQIRREVQAETNEPGYKTKVIREQTAATSRQLAAGAKRILGGAKSIAVKALEASRKEQEGTAPLLPETATGVPGAVDASAAFQSDSTTVPNTMPVEAQSGGAPPTLERLELLDELETEMERILDLLTQYVSSPQETWLNPDLLLQNSNDDQQFTSFPDAELESVVVAMVQAQALLQQPMSTEDERAMISTLDLVLPTINEICDTSVQAGSLIIAEYFKQTLLYGGVENGDTPLMLRLDDCLARLETLEEEQKLTQDIETAMNDAANNEPAVAEAAPWYVEDDEGEAVQETKPWYVEDGAEDGQVVVEVSEPTNFGGFRMPWQRQQQQQQQEIEVDDVQVVEVAADVSQVVAENSGFVADVEILDAIPTTMAGGPAAQATTIVDNDDFSYSQTVVVDQGMNVEFDMATGAQEAADSMRRVSAEVVSDDDFDVAMGQAKVAEEIGEGQEEEEEDELSPAAMFALRSLDVVLLAGEKTASVLPTLINLGGTVTERVANAKNDGLGSDGWEIIQSAQRGDKKY